MFCCGSNAAVVENTRPPAQRDVPPPAPVAPPKPVTTPAPADHTATNAAESKVKEEVPIAKSAPEPKTIPEAEPPIEEKSTEPELPVEEKPAEPEPVTSEEAVTEPQPVTEVSPPVAEPVVEPPKPVEPYLSSILGSSVVSGEGKTLNTLDALQKSALVAIYYGAAAETKKVEVFCAGYEPKTLDVVYCPTEDTDNYVQSSLPKAWYFVPADSLTIKSSIEEKLGISETPSFIVINPETEKIVSDTSAMSKIISLDPLDAAYDTKAAGIFAEWIKDLPMEQDVVGEIEIVVE